MRKLKLIIMGLFMTLTTISFSQADSTAYMDSHSTYWSKETGKKLKTPGNLIIQAQNNKILGSLSTVVGLSIITLPYYTGGGFKNGATVVGLIFCGVGAGLFITSHIKIHNAGILLNENGIGIAVKINK